MKFTFGVSVEIRTAVSGSALPPVVLMFTCQRGEEESGRWVERHGNGTPDPVGAQNLSVELQIET